MTRWRRNQADFDEEIRAHLALEADRLRAEGWPPDDATWEARRRFSNVTRAQERFHLSRRPAWLDAAEQDLRYAWRQLRRAPLFAAAVVLTLALGIGANAVVFGIVDRLLLQPPRHVSAAEGLGRIYFRERSDDGSLGASPVTGYPMITVLREHVPALGAVAAVGFPGPRTLGSGPDAREVELSLVSGNYFALLGVRPVRGRFFAPDEDRESGGAPVAVISEGFWRRHLGGAADVVGREIVIDRRPLTVIGVAPSGFTGIDMERVDVWAPVSTFAAAGMGDDWATNPGNIWLRAVARLAPGATIEQADAQATLAYRRAVRDWKQTWRDSLGTVAIGSIVAARGPGDTPREAKVSLWLVGVSAAVLLVACANVANLLLARAVRRRREIAVRLALGVGRGRLARQLLTETLLLAAIAAVAALVLAHWGGQLMRAVLLPEMAWDGTSPVDGRVLAFTATVTFLTVLLAGLVPALQASRPDVTAALKAGARDSGARRSRLRTTLLVTQAALSVMLLVGAGLFVRSLDRLRTLDVGIDLPRVLLVNTSFASAGYDTTQAEALWLAAAERVRRLPTVERATLVGGTVPTRSANAGGFTIPGRDSLPDLPNGGPYYSLVDADYVATLGSRIVLGRGLAADDVRAGARVAVVNETIARGYWPAGDAVGQCVRLRRDEACTTIVGVVQDALLFRRMNDARGQVYVPFGHPAVSPQRPAALVVRLRDDGATRAAEAARAVQREVQGLADDLGYVSVLRLEDVVAPELQPWRLGATMFAVFGGLALAIAAIGLYSVLAYTVSQRAREIAVRLALGARRADVVGLVLRDGLLMAGGGLALGLLLALAAGPAVESLLYATTPRDPVVLGAATAVLLGVAFVATLIPAWYASRVDPGMTLRQE